MAGAAWLGCTSHVPSIGGGEVVGQWCPCQPPVVHYPYQNWYFLPGPMGLGVLVLKLPLVFVFVVFLLRSCGLGGSIPRLFFCRFAAFG